MRPGGVGVRTHQLLDHVPRCLSGRVGASTTGRLPADHLDEPATVLQSPGADELLPRPAHALVSPARFALVMDAQQIDMLAALNAIRAHVIIRTHVSEAGCWLTRQTELPAASGHVRSVPRRRWCSAEESPATRAAAPPPCMDRAWHAAYRFDQPPSRPLDLRAHQRQDLRRQPRWQIHRPRSRKPGISWQRRPVRQRIEHSTTMTVNVTVTELRAAINVPARRSIRRGPAEAPPRPAGSCQSSITTPMARRATALRAIAISVHF